MKILITCPPMIGLIDRFEPLLRERGLEFDIPRFTQVMPESELEKCIGEYDGWIIGDDPATRAVFEAGLEGQLRAAVKWGVGIDNVDMEAARELGIPIANTPEMFGAEVADVALGYLIGLARELFAIDRAVREGAWEKRRGMSLGGKTAALVGFGDVGRALARRLLAIGMKVVAYDPYHEAVPGLEAVEVASWPDRLEEADVLLFTCALNASNHHMLGPEEFARVNPGLHIVNVARGPLINETALACALEQGRVRSAALDVFEIEPLPERSPLRGFGDRVVFGAHNASNTEQAVVRASHRALDLLCGFLGVPVTGELA
ncbi:MAG: phosphoglycerate dehydrogenase [bacterium]|nr:phosphoglycerate dehydrogenase [bacterium]MCP5044902.1 phosphoglycerate dehydrogenase [bacterium]